MLGHSLQDIVIPLVTALLEKRYQFALAHRKADAPKKAYPKDITFKALADKYGVSPRTLNRWYTGEVKSTRNTKSVSKLKRAAQKEIKSSRSKLSRAGKHIAKQSLKIITHVERLKFQHGRPTWRVHTLGWKHRDITDFVLSIAQEKDKKYEFLFTIWNPQLYPDQAKSGGFISSGWTSTRGKWTKDMLHRWILREHLSRGEIQAIIFTSNK